MVKPKLGVFYWHNPTRLGNVSLVNQLRNEFEIVLISNEPIFPLSGYSDHAIIKHFGNTHELIQDLKQHKNKYGLDGLITLSEGAVTLMADAQEKLNLRGNSPNHSRYGRNKYLMRQLFAKNKIPSPKFVAVSSLKEALNSLDHDFNGSAFLKPPCIGGSSFCSIINSKDQLKRIWDDYFLGSLIRTKKDPLFNEMFGNSSYYLLLEEILGGDKFQYDSKIGFEFPIFEMSVEGFVEGKNTTVYSMTDKLLPKKGILNCEEHLWRMHSRIPPELKKILEKRVSKINRALNMNSGCSHTEFRIEKTTSENADICFQDEFYRARVIETAMRIGGAFMQPAIYNATGFNSIRAMAYQACGIEHSEKITHKIPMIMGNIWPKQPGNLEGIQGLDKLLALKEKCGGVHIYDSIGDKIEMPPYASRAIGDFIIQDPSIDLLETPNWETSNNSPYAKTEELFLKTSKDINVQVK